MTTPAPARPGRPRLQLVAGEAALEGEWASDHWDASRLGIPARRGRATARFDQISQAWLRDPVKRWSRFRLATGCAFATIDAGALALTRFSWFLAACHPQVQEPAAITRPVLEDYLSWLVTPGILGAHPGTVAVDGPGVLRGLPPPQLAAWTCRGRDHLR